jgi:transcriptional regulator with XRE-family HTH domain
MGTRIAEVRIARNMTQQQLANKAGLSIRTIAYAEAARDIRVSTLRDIAAALGVSVGELLEPDEVSA